MRFSQFAFGLRVPVRPVAIRLLPALPLEADTVWDPLPVNICFALFQPWQTFVLTPLLPSYISKAFAAWWRALPVSHAAADL